MEARIGSTPGGERDPLALVLTAQHELAAGRGCNLIALRAIRPTTAGVPAGLGVRAAEAAPGEIILATSGSTAAPRLIVRSAASWDDSCPAVDRCFGLRPDDVIWAPGPADSSLTLFAIWHAVRTGRPVVTGSPGAPKPAQRSSLPVATQPEDATVLHAVPALASEVLAWHMRGALPRLRLLIVAGSHVPKTLRERCSAAGLALVEYYGAAELSFVGYDPDGRGLRPFEGVEVEILDGQIWIRSPWLARRAGDAQPDERPTLRVPTPGAPCGSWHVDAHGRHCVGDRGRFTGPSERGAEPRTFEVLGRGLAHANVGGRSVDLEQVESALGEAAQVQELVCVAVPHPRWGSVVVALVRPEAGEDPRASLRVLARSLPAASRPVRYLMSDQVPRTPGGKVDRRAVLHLFRGGGEDQ